MTGRNFVTFEPCVLATFLVTATKYLTEGTGGRKEFFSFSFFFWPLVPGNSRHEQEGVGQAQQVAARNAKYLCSADSPKPTD